MKILEFGRIPAFFLLLQKKRTAGLCGASVFALRANTRFASPPIPCVAHGPVRLRRTARARRARP
jgi:hypothetical protein